MPTGAAPAAPQAQGFQGPPPWDTAPAPTAAPMPSVPDPVQAQTQAYDTAPPFPGGAQHAPAQHAPAVSMPGAGYAFGPSGSQPAQPAQPAAPAFPAEPF